MTSSVPILRDLIAFPTVSAESNLSLITYCEDLLKSIGADVTLIQDSTKKKANLYATLGPRDEAGVLLSGHTDVVPVTGQDWTVPPFEMSERDGLCFGRGTADMKGFVACALAAAERAAARKLTTPLHIALSHDEEVGCIGVRSLIDMLETAPIRPLLCIVGEPTSMQVAIGHKGKTAARVTTTGRAAHSALAPTALNAIHLACDMIGFIRELQAEIARDGAHDPAYEVPYTTIHVGQISGGIALNIVPDRAEFVFEVRNLPEDDPNDILGRIEARKSAYLEAIRKDYAEAEITVEITNSYPSLSTDSESDCVKLAQELGGSGQTLKVAFGTEGGLFSSRLLIPTVVCGPGSMDQGHKPDEFISRAQMAACDDFMDALLDRLEAGL